MLRFLFLLLSFSLAARASAQGFEQTRDFQLWTLKGISLQGVGQPKESLAAFRRALAVNPKFLPALQGTAQLEYQLQDPNRTACKSCLTKSAKTMSKLRVTGWCALLKAVPANNFS